MKNTVKSWWTVIATVALVSCSPVGNSPGDKAFTWKHQGIQGGTVDNADTNVVGILISSPTDYAVCSGSLIGPNLVLTAHHCIADVLSTQCAGAGYDVDYPVGYFFVTTSTTALATAVSSSGNPHVDNQTWFAVSRVASGGNSFCGGDLAILELSANMPSSVCPLIPRVDSSLAVGDTYRAVGFGNSDPNTVDPGTRRQVGGMLVQCIANCSATIPTPAEWVGGSNSMQGACEGDSGGPSLDAQNRVTGAVSRGPANDCNVSVYESTFGQAAWIKQQATLAAANGHYTAAGWVTGASTLSANSGYCGTGGGSATGGGTAAGGGSATGGGTASTGGGSSSSGGGTASSSECPCSLHCSDVSGRLQCTDPEVFSGIPPSAPTCGSGVACPSGFFCFTTTAGGFCLQNCSNRDAGIVACGSSGGGSATGGGTAAAGGNAGGSGGAGFSGGGSADAGVNPPKTGNCGCTSTPGNAALWLALLAAVSRRRLLR